MSSGVTAPQGFRASAAACGIKPQGPDLALIVADSVCSAAAVLTTNRAQAAPILVSRKHLAAGRARGIVANAGCANAATGERGIEDAREMAALTAQAVGASTEEIVVASTGVIGVNLPMEKIRAGIAAAASRLSPEGGAEAAKAILTTDTQPKEVVVEFALGGDTARVACMAKGSGMIAPNMATMLAFFTTDVAITPALLHRALVEAVGVSLNRITIDGDTSTNDMAVILASGKVKAPALNSDDRAYRAFCSALTEASRRTAQLIVRDGEGATRIAEVRVEGARVASDADRIARTVAESPLVKTALYGSDANWGRILAAVGRAGVDLQVSQVDIFLGDIWVAEGGQARSYDEALARKALTEDPVRILIRLHAGEALGFMWTCDLSREYVEINANYRT